MAVDKNSNKEFSAEKPKVAERKKACINCGAELYYNPGSTEIKCPYCGSTEQIDTPIKGFNELALHPYLEEFGSQVNSTEISMLKCENCGATQHTEENYKSLHCVYCSMPLILEDSFTEEWILPGALVPFRIDKAKAHSIFNNWVKRLWFAPNKLKKAAIDPEYTKGLYLPYWTFDAKLFADYTGERGDYYFVTQTYNTVENGRSVTKTRQVQKTRWSPANGSISGFIDDTLIKAFKQRNPRIPEKISNWDLTKLHAFDSKYLAGFVTEKYTISLLNGHIESNKEAEQIAKTWIRRDIGGDEQRIHQMHMTLKDETFKHILLPVYISSFKYNKQVYNFIINGENGSISGKRPYSFWKIFFTVLGGIVLILIFTMISGGL